MQTVTSVSSLLRQFPVGRDQLPFPAALPGGPPYPDRAQKCGLPFRERADPAEESTHPTTFFQVPKQVCNIFGSFALLWGTLLQFFFLKDSNICKKVLNFLLENKDGFFSYFDMRVHFFDRKWIQRFSN
jgi:hypothetical protein